MHKKNTAFPGAFVSPDAWRRPSPTWSKGKVLIDCNLRTRGRSWLSVGYLRIGASHAGASSGTNGTCAVRPVVQAIGRIGRNVRCRVNSVPALLGHSGPPRSKRPEEAVTE